MRTRRIHGARKFVPERKENLRSYSGTLLKAHVPQVEQTPLFMLNDNRVFGMQEPVDWVPGIQEGAEAQVVFDYWDLDELEGEVIVCPVQGRSKETLHWLIELAYKLEPLVSGLTQLGK